jgi:ubiquinone/menaquinone biosynthesis C-methylase UbiE
MKMAESGWEKIYTKKDKWILDWFGKKAYMEYKKWINANDKKILDAGFGSGRFCIALARDFPRSKIYGIDISMNLVKNAKRIASELNLKNLKFNKDSIFDISFPDNYFDVVFNEGVIEHFDNHEDAFKQMYRVTKKGGTIIVGVPNWYNFPHTIRKWYIDKVKGRYEYGYEKSFKHGELIRLFRKYDLKDIEMTGYYPMQSIIRLSVFSKFSMLFNFSRVNIWGKWVEKFVIYPIDKLTNNGLSRKFGFEIVIKGIK